MVKSPAPVANHPCAACQPDGEPDDHPMIHVAPAEFVMSRKPDGSADAVVTNPSFHFDCLPPEFERMLRADDGTAHPQHATTVAAIDAARAGTRGHALYAFISDHVSENGSDNEVGAG